jgi:hypothetical protein
MIEGMERRLEEEAYKPSKSKAVAKIIAQLGRDMVAAADDEGKFMGKTFMLLSQIEDLLFESGSEYRKASDALGRVKTSLSAVPEVNVGLKRLGW